MKTDAAVVLPLLNGRTLVLHDGVLSIRDRTDAVVARVEMDDVTGINRGGSDLIITRRETDPIVITAAVLADAQRFIQSVKPQRTFDASQARRRWRWQRRNG